MNEQTETAAYLKSAKRNTLAAWIDLDAAAEREPDETLSRKIRALWRQADTLRNEIETLEAGA